MTLHTELIAQIVAATGFVVECGDNPHDIEKAMQLTVT